MTAYRREQTQPAPAARSNAQSISKWGILFFLMADQQLSFSGLVVGDTVEDL
jgi:hypothetical protein